MSRLKSALVDFPTAGCLMRGGMASAQDIGLLEKELAEPEAELGGHCPFDAERLRSWDAVEKYGMWLYVLVRVTQPAIVLETGVQNGCSTEMLLWALFRNRHGRLYSIDSGPSSSDGSHRTGSYATRDGVPGRDILPGLRKLWELEIGLSRDRLPGACRRLGKVDLFWHDSDHSSGNVAFEFDTVKVFVPAGGVLCLHDFQGQGVDLEEPGYRLVVPQKAPFLRVWRKEEGAG